MAVPAGAAVAWSWEYNNFLRGGGEQHGSHQLSVPGLATDSTQAWELAEGLNALQQPQLSPAVPPRLDTQPSGAGHQPTKGQWILKEAFRVRSEAVRFPSAKLVFASQ